MSIRKGDIVGRKSYNKDIYFIVDKVIISSLNKQIAILKGLNIRVMADSSLEDLEIISKEEIINSIRLSETDLENRIKRNRRRVRQKIYTGKILHLDGDTHLSNLKKYRKINTYKQVIFNHINFILKILFFEKHYIKCFKCGIIIID